jgi:nucleoside-diphosphate-sugar epimerase
MMQISILGCGWLGFPLAKSFVEKGISVNGSTTSFEKLSILENAKINPFLISVNEKNIEGNLEAFLQNSEILIINIPPKLRTIGIDTSTALNMTFVSKIENIILFIEKSSVKKVIFVSSTSVYAEDTSTALSVTESTIPKPETESGKQLLEVEKLLLENPNFKTTIIRFGGLIGGDRNPTRMLSGKKDIPNPDAPINLIHQEDCIGIIHKIIDNWLRQAQPDNYKNNEIYNGVAPFHPTRKEYYTQKAMVLGLEIPEFDYSKQSNGKMVSSKKVIKSLNYLFLKPNL